ncbi:MAG TPA: hypothetical protein VGL29_12230 [Blastocatellia bacterium]
MEKASQERKNDPNLVYGAGMVAAARARRGEALRIIEQLEQMSGPSLNLAHLIARIYATMNENELALGWLERGLEAGATPIFFKDAPVWDPIRSDARFGDLLRRMAIH